MSQPYDQPIIDIVAYIYKYPLDTTTTETWNSARTALLDALGCAIETAASKRCDHLLGPVDGTIAPNGFKVPGTNLQVDTVKAAFDLAF
jgi:2-methylcitrate dehydratase